MHAVDVLTKKYLGNFEINLDFIISEFKKFLEERDCFDFVFSMSENIYQQENVLPMFVNIVRTQQNSEKYRYRKISSLHRILLNRKEPNFIEQIESKVNQHVRIKFKIKFFGAQKELYERFIFVSDENFYKENLRFFEQKQKSLPLELEKNSPNRYNFFYIFNDQKLLKFSNDKQVFDFLFQIKEAHLMRELFLDIDFSGLL